MIPLIMTKREVYGAIPPRVYHRVYIGRIPTYLPGYTTGCTGRAYAPPRVYLRVYKGSIYTT